MKLHPHKDSKTGKWNLVSSKYSEASPGSVGGGMIIAKTFDTREAARKAYKHMRENKLSYPAESM